MSPAETVFAMAKLVVIRGDTEQREFRLDGEVVLGRSAECEVVIPGPLSSRRHARISREGDGWLVEDLNSSNGTLLNGRSVTTSQLRDGDWLAIGDCQLTFLLDDDYVPPRAAVLLEEGMPTVVESLDVTAVAGAGVGVAGPAAAEKLGLHLRVLRELAEESCGMPPIDGLLGRILGQLFRVYPQAEHAHAVLFGFDEAGDDLRLSVGRAGDAGPEAGPSRTLLDMVTREQRAVLADAGSDARLQEAQSIVGEGVQSIMCSPLVVRERVLGALQVDTTDAESPFTPDDLRLLVTVSGQTAIAAENVRLQREFVARERLAAVGQALSSVAHCIKNTLNTVAGGTYIVDLGLRDDDLAKVGKGWDMVKRSTGFMAQLVKDMLTYCRRGGLSRTETDIGQLLRETLSMAEQPALEAGVELSLNVPEDLPPVEVDPVALKRAVLNLFVNAVEACSEGCQVQASAEAAAGGERLRLLVSDDGPGMPEEVRQHLFEPFYTTKGNKGTGLGLALVKKVVEGHRGSIEVQSEVGEGTTFVILLPVEGTATQLRAE